MMLELTQLMWLRTPKGEGIAKFLIDYGPDADLMWVVVQADGEIWTWSNWDVRVVRNTTLGIGIGTTSGTPATSS